MPIGPQGGTLGAVFAYRYGYRITLRPPYCPLMRAIPTLLFALLLACVAPVAAVAQAPLQTQTAHVTFLSTAPAEVIKAENAAATAALNPTNGTLAFRIEIRKFQFENSLMQEHFNENYMESGRFPHATFAGQIVDFSASMLANGTRTVKVKGKLTIHGVERTVEMEAKLEVTGGVIKATCNFWVALADHNIEIPSVVGQNIAERALVHVQADWRR